MTRLPVARKKGRVEMQQVLDWWDSSAPIPLAKVPTLFTPKIVVPMQDGEEMEVHPDRTGSYRFILVRRRGESEEVRGLPSSFGRDVP